MVIKDLPNSNEQENMQSLAQETDERNRIFIQQAPNAIAMFDMNMCYLAASERWLKDYKLTGKEIIGRSHYDLFPEIGDDWKAIHQACLRGEINQCDEASFVRADGTLQWITWDVRPWYHKKGVIGGLLMYTADITALKEKELERSKIEQILDKTSEVARIGTWEVDLVNNVVHWSRVTKEIHEVDPSYVPDLETGINFFREGTSRELIKNAVADAIQHGTTYDLEVELITAKGNFVWTRAIGQAEFKNGKCIRLYGVFQDIDGVKRAKESLHVLNEELNTILNAGYVSLIGTDLKGLITHFSKGAEALLQYTAAEMIGVKTPEQIHLKEEVMARAEELSVLRGKEIHGFSVFTEIPTLKGFESREWTYIRKDGSRFPVQLVVTSIKDSNGEVVGFLGVATDISAIKKADMELKALLEITTDQNERLRNFAHIVSHNLRSHTSNLDMLLDLFITEHKDVKDNPYLELLQVALQNLKETISNLNEVVLLNSSTADLEPMNLFELVRSSSQNVSQLAKSANVEVFNEVDKEICIMAYPAYADSIILNFITNSIKYRSEERNSYISFSSSLSEGYVVLKIKDNGIGIDLKRNRSKLFGMYKTFNGNADARGIGLFITKNQVEAMGGKIEVESELNQGTTFSVFFKNEKD